MDKEFKDEVLKWLMGIRETSNDAAQFAIEQAPLVAQEYLNYWTVVHATWAILFAVLWLAVWVASRKIPVWVGSYDPFPLRWGLRIAATLVALGVAVPNTIFAIKCQVAPRLVILEWAVEAIKRII